VGGERGGNMKGLEKERGLLQNKGTKEMTAELRRNFPLLSTPYRTCFFCFSNRSLRSD